MPGMRIVRRLRADFGSVSFRAWDGGTFLKESAADTPPAAWESEFGFRTFQKS